MNKQKNVHVRLYPMALIVKDVAVTTGLPSAFPGIPSMLLPGSLTCYDVWLTATVFRLRSVPVRAFMIEHVN